MFHVIVFVFISCSLVWADSIKGFLEAKILHALNIDTLSARTFIQLDPLSEKKFFQIVKDNQFECQNVQFDHIRRTFSALVQSPAEVGFKISGQIIDLIDIPVLNKPIAVQETIQSGDIQWIKVPSNKVSSTTMTSAPMMVGRVSKNRTLYPNVPIMASDLQQPVLVKRGSLVSVKYSIPNMELSTQAIAKRDGVLGETIELSTMQNNDSANKINKVIYATVIGPNQAQVSTVLAR